MVVFTYAQHGIAVIRTTPKGRKAEGIGRFQFSREWLWDAGRASLHIYRTLDHSEKRTIIGMLDALNGQPVRPITGMKQRWEEIIGLASVESLTTDNVDWEAISPMNR